MYPGSVWTWENTTMIDIEKLRESDPEIAGVVEKLVLQVNEYAGKVAEKTLENLSLQNELVRLQGKLEMIQNISVFSDQEVDTDS